MAELPPAATPMGVGYTGPLAATELAGFGRRFAAYLIDSVIIGIAASVITLIINGIASGDTTSGFWRPGLISLFLGLVYFGFLWARSGQSVGYMAMGIRLVRADGGQVSFALGMFRYLVLYLSVVVCAVPALISAFMVGMGQRKQALQDLVAGTLVVRA